MAKKWNRKLGTSKREQGIVTPKAPQNKRKKPVKKAEKKPETVIQTIKLHWRERWSDSG